MRCSTTKLNDHVELLSGFAFKSKYFSEDPRDIPLVKGSNVGQGEIAWDKSVYWPRDDETDYSKFCLVSGDVVVAMDRPWVSAGLKWAYIREDDPESLLVQRCARLRSNSKDLDQRFLRYIIGSKGFEDYIRPITTGVNVPHVSGQQILDYEFSLPPISTQIEIHDILSAYDDLIENCRRRIVILEEMARSLYREWFVHFRFPGHEECEFVESELGQIPSGWKVKKVEDCFEITGGGTPSRKVPEYWEGGDIKWFAPRDLTAKKSMFMDDSSDHITAEGLAKSSAKLFPKRSVMLTSRATIGAVSINTGQASTNQGFITCIPNDGAPLYWLYHWITENVPVFERLASGSTFKEISKGVFRKIPMVHPARNTVVAFESFCQPIGDQVLILQRQIENLRETRDLLLPRLMSGQINLEEA